VPPSASEEQYRFVFNESPIAMYLEDWTGVGAVLEPLRETGVTDIRKTLYDDVGLLQAAVSSIEILDVNPAAVQLVGAESREDLLGPLPAEIVKPETIDSFVDQIEAVWNGKRRIDIELEGLTFGGITIDCLLHWTAPRVDGDVDLSRVVVAITDISNRKEEERQVVAIYEELMKAYDELGETQAQLLQAQRLESIGELAAGIAHEINTPIQYVGDNIRFIQESLDDLQGAQHAAASLRAAIDSGDLESGTVAYDDVHDSLDVEFLRSELPVATQQAIEGIGRVAEIVRALKDFAHPGSETPTPIDLNAAIETTISVSRNEWKYVAELTTDFDDSLDAVPALAGPINQALLNIIVNGAHAIADKVGERPAESERGRISITTRRRDGHAEIRISDTGGGIPDGVRSRIFDPFFTTKEVGKGSGQGLAIAHNVVCDQHGGSISVETAPHVGTTFIVRIPLEVGHEGEMAA